MLRYHRILGFIGLFGFLSSSVHATNPIDALVAFFNNKKRTKPLMQKNKETGLQQHTNSSCDDTQQEMQQAAVPYTMQLITVRYAEKIATLRARFGQAPEDIFELVDLGNDRYTCSQAFATGFAVLSDSDSCEQCKQLHDALVEWKQKNNTLRNDAGLAPSSVIVLDYEHNTTSLVVRPNRYIWNKLLDGAVETTCGELLDGVALHDTVNALLAKSPAAIGGKYDQWALALVTLATGLTFYLRPQKAE